MTIKLPVLGFALVTALSGTALAHEPHHSNGAPTGYHPAAHGHGNANGYGNGYGRGNGGYGRGGPAVSRGGYAQTPAVDLRYADLNRDGLVSLNEALDSGRQVFHRYDRDNNRVLTGREVARPEIAQDDRDRDGRLSMREHQRAVRAQFASIDRNRDGYLARYELGGEGPRGRRSAGWWR
jgi:hypothetical protein